MSGEPNGCQLVPVEGVHMMIAAVDMYGASALVQAGG